MACCLSLEIESLFLLLHFFSPDVFLNFLVQALNICQLRLAIENSTPLKRGLPFLFVYE